VAVWVVVLNDAENFFLYMITLIKLIVNRLLGWIGLGIVGEQIEHGTINKCGVEEKISIEWMEIAEHRHTHLPLKRQRRRGEQAASNCGA
jgi:hypothetical protein